MINQQTELLINTQNLSNNELERYYLRNIQNIRNNMNLDELEKFCILYEKYLSNSQTSNLITEILQNSIKLRTMNISKFIANYFKPFGFFKKIAYNFDDKAIFDLIFKVKIQKIKKYQNFQLSPQKIYVVMNNELILFQKTNYDYDINLEFYNLGIEDFYAKFDLYFINHQINEQFIKQIEERLNCQQIIQKFQNCYNKRESLGQQLLYICYILTINLNYQLIRIQYQGEVIEDSNDEILMCNQTLDLVVFDQNHHHILNKQIQQRNKKQKIENLYKCAIFNNISKRIFNLLINKSQILDIQMNQTIQNQENNFIFIILHGQVNLYLKIDLQNYQTKKLLICQLQENQIFGDLNQYEAICQQDGQICKINKKLIETGFFGEIQKNINDNIQEKEQRYIDKIKLDISNWDEIAKIDGNLLKDEEDQFKNKQQKKRIRKKQTCQKIQKMNIQIWNERIQKMNGEVKIIPTKKLNDQILQFKKQTHQKMIQELNKGLYKQPKKQYLKQKKDTYLLKVNTNRNSPIKQKSIIEKQEIKLTNTNQVQNSMITYYNKRIKQDRNKSQIENNLQISHNKNNRSVQLDDCNKSALKMLKRVRDKMQLSGSKEQESSLFTLNQSKLKTDYSINSLNNKNLNSSIGKKLKQNSKNNFNNIIKNIVKPKLQNYM